MKKVLFFSIVISCFFFTNKLSAQPQVKSTQPELYRVGINDLININVAGQKDFSTVTTVSIDGTISYPYVGNIYVVGLTLSDIQNKVTEILSEGILKMPVVTVSLVKSDSKKIFVIGEDVATGTIPYDRTLTLEKALIIMGGIKIGSPFSTVTIKRKNKKITGKNEFKFRFKEILEGQKDTEIFLEPGDILIINKSPKILIQGEVVKPGVYNLDENMTVGKALSIAGGVSEGGLYGTVKLRRMNKEGTVYEDLTINLNDILSGKELSDLLLEPDDIVLVQRNETFFIHGEVMRPGKYVLEEGMTVIKALTESGGKTEEGLYGKVKIRRKRGDGPGYEDIEVNLKGILDGTEIEDIMIKPDDIIIVERSKNFLIQGEVEKPGAYVLEHNMTIGRALSLAGGVKEGGLHGKVKLRRAREDSPGYDDIDLDLRRILQGDEVADMLVKPEDTIIVERNKTILIYGEVQNIGEYPLSDGMTVFKAIILAGGFNKWGSPSNVKVLRQTDGISGFETIKVNIKKLLKGDPTEDVLLQPGDIIVVSAGGIL